jgi:hypothetical protein
MAEPKPPANRVDVLTIGRIGSSRRECSTAMPATAEIENIAKDLSRVDA